MLVWYVIYVSFKQPGHFNLLVFLRYYYYYCRLLYVLITGPSDTILLLLIYSMSLLGINYTQELGIVKEVILQSLNKVIIIF